MLAHCSQYGGSFVSIVPVIRSVSYRSSVYMYSLDGDVAEQPRWNLISSVRFIIRLSRYRSNS